MTALKKYARLEATALWRAAPDVQRRDVVVSIGDATLVITDMKDQPLTHWSLSAVERANPGKRPAIYNPDGDPGETLEFAENETEFVDAIEKLRRAIDRTRPHPGRLRWVGVALSCAIVAALILFWLPGAMLDHTLRVVPEVKRKQIGTALVQRLERVTGPACADDAADIVLANLSDRLDAGRVLIMPDMTKPSMHLPGDLILLDRAIVEDFEDPEVAAGYVLTERTLSQEIDPLREMLETLGLRENFRLLTTGEIAPSALDIYAKHLVTRPTRQIDSKAQLSQFSRAQIRSTPYAYAVDVTGESVIDLIEGDPMNGQSVEPLMSDGDWLRMQNICGG